MWSDRSSAFVKFEGGSDLSWKDVSVSIPQSHSKKNGGEKVVILSGVSGEARCGELSVLMGASGSGKTSLLSVLAGITVPTKKTIVSGNLKFGNDVINPTSRAYQNKLAYLSQHDDDLLASATPRECIAYSARLRLPATVTYQDIEEQATTILEEMDLTGVGDKFIGGARIRGLSGGEKRRVSLALALVVRPTIILADEITSGLDTYNAGKVLNILKKVARNGCAVLTSIHQPTSAMFEDFDYITMVRKGRCMFKGCPADLAEYFDDHELQVPAHYSHPDWMLEVSQSHSTEDLEAKGFFQGFPERPSLQRSSVRVPSIYETATARDRLSVHKEVWELSKREFRNLYRDKVVMAIRMLVLLGGSILMIIAMPGVAREPFDSIESFSTHVGAVFLALFVTFSPVLFILVEFPDKRRVFINEFRMNYFRMSSFVLYTLMFELATMTFQVLLYLIPTYFGLGLQGGFWYLFAIFFWYASSCSATALLIASTLPNPEHAADIFPLTLRK